MKSTTRTTAAKAARVKVNVMRLPHAGELPLPTYQPDGAAGLDLLAALEAGNPMVLAPGARALVPTGLTIELPKGYEAQVRPRSGLALNYGVTVLNSPGTIDSDYRGEVKVLLINLGGAPWEIQRGERIAQLVFQRVARADLVEVATLNDTRRGAGGFGSTGMAGVTLTPQARPHPPPKSAASIRAKRSPEKPPK